MTATAAKTSPRSEFALFQTYYTGQGVINQSNQFAVERQRACVRELSMYIVKT